MANTANNPWANSPTPPAAPQEDTADKNTQPPQAPVNPLLSNSSNPLLPDGKPTAPVFGAQPQAEDKAKNEDKAADKAEDTKNEDKAKNEDKPAEQAEQAEDKSADKAADKAEDKAEDKPAEQAADTKEETIEDKEAKDESKDENKDEPAKKTAKKSPRRKSRAKSTKSKDKDSNSTDTETIDELAATIKSLARQMSDKFSQLGTLAPAQAIEAIDAADRDDEELDKHLDDLNDALVEYRGQRKFISGKRSDLRAAYEQVVNAFKDIETDYDDADK